MPRPKCTHEYTRFCAVFRSNPLIFRDIPEFYPFRGVRSGGLWGRLSGRLSSGRPGALSGRPSGRLSTQLLGTLSSGLSSRLSGRLSTPLSRGLSTGRSTPLWTPLRELRSDFVLVSSFELRTWVFAWAGILVLNLFHRLSFRKLDSSCLGALVLNLRIRFGFAFSRNLGLWLRR